MCSKRTLTAFVTLLVIGTSSAASAAATADPYHPVSSHGIPKPKPLRVSAAENTINYWYQDAQAAIDEKIDQGFRGYARKARNVVMFLGDGMSVPTLAAARTLLGQRNGQTGEEAQLSFEAFPTAGLAKTYCVNAQIADSACTSTAYLTGVKANSGTIGVSADVPRWNCEASIPKSRHTESIAAWALADGRDAGVVTTTRVTHASPAGAYAHVANRHWENDAEVLNDSGDPNVCPDIAHQLVHSYPGNQFKVILGGGRREFLPVNNVEEPGKRTDGKNLIEEWKADKADRNASYQYIQNKQELLQVNENLPDYLLGLFEMDHLKYHLESNVTNDPTLADLTETAINMLKRNENGFFLFVEGGRIDHAHHENFVHLALDETIEMHKAVARASQLLSKEDSLIVVTSDHAHVMAFNGYTQRGSDVLGLSGSRDSRSVNYMTLSYTNGPGFRPHVDGVRPDVSQEVNYRQTNWRAHVDVPLASETHGGDDVAVFASGPHHQIFTGLYEQSHIPHRMAYAACIGPGLHACNHAGHFQKHSFIMIVPLLFMFRHLLGF